MPRDGLLLFDRVDAPPGSHARSAATRIRDNSRVLFVSNGRGEDEIACRVAARLRMRADASLSIEGWPMVGDGDAYQAAAIAFNRTRSLLPGEGFGTLSLGSFVRDLRAGWLRVHAQQIREAARLRERFDLIVAVGDIVPLAVATIARTPFISIGCAKSVYYGPRFGFNTVERWMLKHGEAVCFTRDARTGRMLRKAGVRARYVGNPVMDHLEPTGQPIPWRDGESVVACFPGSRGDREHNAVSILRLVALGANIWERHGAVHLAFAVPRVFELERFQAAIAQDLRARAWQTLASGTSSLLLGLGRLRASFSYAALGDVLHKARVAIGLGGTVNEQAIGCGVPCVTFATSGPQGRAYLRMKMPYFGDAALEVAPEATPLANAVLRILTDDVLHARMRRAGAERMGIPGATDAIVDSILRKLAGAEEVDTR